MSKVKIDDLIPGTIVMAGLSSFSGKINFDDYEPTRMVIKFRYPDTDIFWLTNEKPLVLNWGQGISTTHESGGFKYRLKDIKQIVESV